MWFFITILFLKDYFSKYKMSEEYLSREELRKLKEGDVLKYNDNRGTCYLIVEEVIEGRVHGQIASPIGVNAISIDELVKKNPRLGKFD